MRMIAAVGLAALVGACATAPPKSAEYERMSAEVGQTLWRDPAYSYIRVCERPGINQKCERVTTEKFTVEGVEGIYYRMRMDNGQVGYVDTFARTLFLVDKDPVLVAAECKRRGDPHVGMTANQVIATCWGKPEHVNRTETAGVISDQYVYSGGRYVYLRNGVVTSLQMSGTLAR